MAGRIMAGALESALAFARAGFPVFPCGHDKRPLVKWTEAATTDDATICRWWRKWPDAMIGLPTGSTSGLYVIDLDVDKEIRCAFRMFRQ